MTKKVYMDKGHGGTDPGAVGNGLQEKVLTHKIVEYAEKYMLDTYDDVQVKTSRNGDQTRTLKQRTDDANKWGAHVFWSAHINAGGGTGFESFIYNGGVGASTIAFQNVVHGEVMAAIRKFGSIRDRGKKRANFHVVRESRMEAILTEVLFIDTRADANQLKKESFLKAVGEAHARGIAKFLGLKEKKKPAPKKTTDSGVMYRVVTGSFKDRDNAEDRVKALKAKGFDSFIDAVKL